jgi:hypothetical protein
MGVFSQPSNERRKHEMTTGNSIHSQLCLAAMARKDGTRDYQGDKLALGDRIIFAPEAGILREGIIIEDCYDRSYSTIMVKSTRSEACMLIAPEGCIRVPSDSEDGPS